MGLLNNSDAAVYRKYFKEMAKLVGITVYYRYPIDMDFSNYGDENPLGFSEPEQMNIVFEENPSIRTLKRLGWFTENAERQPLVAQLPFDAKNLCKGCRISIRDNLRDFSRDFVVTDIKSNLEFPDSWICKIAPVFGDKETVKEVETKTTNENNSYINVN